MKYVLLVWLLFCAVFVQAGDKWTFSEEVQSVSVTHSSWTWTRIPPATAWVDTARHGIRIDLDNACTDYVLWSLSKDNTHGPNYGGTPFIGEVSTTTAYGDTTEGWKYKETDPPWYIECPADLYIWMNVQGDGSETLYYQQFRKR